MSWFDKLKKGLKKTARTLQFKRVDAAGLDELEESLLVADVGYDTTRDIMAAVKSEKPVDSAALRATVEKIILGKMTPVASELHIDASQKPFVILMIGVNGAGKTTTIGKLAQQYKNQGLQISLVAGDTFRAGAVEQLKKWGERAHVTVHAGAPNADAAGLIFDALTTAEKNGDDVVLIDTAGRLHNSTDLMNELQKIVRVMRKKIPSAPHATVLVLDATVGQNALQQVKVFGDMIGVTGLVMTKLDGTAKGGILIALADKFHLPIYAVGVGEGVEDLHSFSAPDYVAALLGEDE